MKQIRAAVIIVTGLVVLPAAVFALEPLVQCGNEIDSNNPNVSQFCKYSDLIGPGGLVDRVVQFALFFIAMPAAVAVTIYGGFLLLTSGGDEGRISKGKSVIKAVAWGLAISFGAFLIVRTVLTLLF
jgi:hypothetical protein